MSRRVAAALALLILLPGGRRAQPTILVPEVHSVLAEDPSVEVIPIDQGGQPLTAAQRAFRERW